MFDLACTRIAFPVKTPEMESRLYTSHNFNCNEFGLLCVGNVMGIFLSHPPVNEPNNFVPFYTTQSIVCLLDKEEKKMVFATGRNLVISGKHEAPL